MQFLSSGHLGFLYQKGLKGTYIRKKNASKIRIYAKKKKTMGGKGKESRRKRREGGKIKINTGYWIMEIVKIDKIDETEEGQKRKVMGGNT